MRNRQKGFSLIKLLIVVAIILIIAAIAIPNLRRSKIAANQPTTAGHPNTFARGRKGKEGEEFSSFSFFFSSPEGPADLYRVRSSQRQGPLRVQQLEITAGSLKNKWEMSAQRARPLRSERHGVCHTRWEANAL